MLVTARHLDAKHGLSGHTGAGRHEVRRPRGHPPTPAFAKVSERDRAREAYIFGRIAMSRTVPVTPAILAAIVPLPVARSTE